jgi:D-alanine-D-alanine ligase
LDILVLMGGASPEREVSLNSGKAVARVLRASGHTVVIYDLNPSEGRDVFDLVGSSSLKGAEVVFIALHGGEGEDGRIQALLDLAGVPYTGSGILASAVCMDKSISKMVFERYGIPTAPWVHLRNPREDVADVRQAISGIGGLPIVVKPVDQGSTIGVSIVHDNGDLQSAIDLAHKYSPRLILEKYIAGRELSVSIVGDEVFPVVEILPREGFYDYHRKYTQGMTDYQCPAILADDVALKIQQDAMQGYKALGCEGFGRVDLRLGEDGIPYFLEVNSIPGMTETSLVPMAAEAGGVSFAELIDRITSYALKKAGMQNPNTGG